MKNIAIFASGEGSNFISIHRNIGYKKICGEIVLLVSNNPNSGAVKYAKKHKISILINNKVIEPVKVNRDKDLLDHLLSFEIDLICLAGYLRLIPKNVINKFNNRIINIHPSLLPKYGGKGYFGIKVHKAVIASRAKETGVTIHIVNEEYDKGKIILQEKVIIKKGDTAEHLSQRVLNLEHELYPKVIQKICNGTILSKYFQNNLREKVEN